MWNIDRGANWHTNKACTVRLEIPQKQTGNKIKSRKLKAKNLKPAKKMCTNINMCASDASNCQAVVENNIEAVGRSTKKMGGQWGQSRGRHLPKVGTRAPSMGIFRWNGAIAWRTAVLDCSSAAYSVVGDRLGRAPASNIDPASHNSSLWRAPPRRTSAVKTESAPRPAPTALSTPLLAAHQLFRPHCVNSLWPASFAIIIFLERSTR